MVDTLWSKKVKLKLEDSFISKPFQRKYYLEDLDTGEITEYMSKKLSLEKAWK